MATLYYYSEMFNRDGSSTTIIPYTYILYIKYIGVIIIIKPIIDYDGYFISDKGEVFCNLGKGNRRNGVTVDLYKINNRLTKHGYARVYIRQISTNKRKDLYIHRLVAEYFLENPNDYKYVNHINCDRLDNNVENLEWCTQKQNTDQTINLKHLLRGFDGRYVSNYDYENKKILVN